MKTYMILFLIVVPWFLLFCLVLGFVMGYRESLRDQKEQEHLGGVSPTEVDIHPRSVRLRQLSHDEELRIVQLLAASDPRYHRRIH